MHRPFTKRFLSCLTIFPLRCTRRSPPVLILLCPWLVCVCKANSVSYGQKICASHWKRQALFSTKPSAWLFPTRRLPCSPSEPRGGSPGYNWRPFLSRIKRMFTVLCSRFVVLMPLSWTILQKKCFHDSPSLSR